MEFARQELALSQPGLVLWQPELPAASVAAVFVSSERERQQQRSEERPLRA
jgi:hypothetical protein